MIRQQQTRRKMTTTHDYDLGPCIATFAITFDYLPIDNLAENWRAEISETKHKRCGIVDHVRPSWDGLWEWMAEGVVKAILDDLDLQSDLIQRAEET